MSPDRAKRQRPSRGKSLIPDASPRNPAKIIYIEAEGEVTERDYCVALNNIFGTKHGFRIITPYKTKGSSPLEVAERAIRVAAQAGEQSEPGADVSPSPLQQVWALFDRDQHPDVLAAFARIREHNAEAETKPGMIKVGTAFSSPSFDLWLLLHFQTVSSPLSGSNDWIHQKLRKCPDFRRFGRDTAGSKRLTEEQAAQLLRPDRLAAAVQNARSLVKACPVSGCSASAGHADECDPLRRDPSTDLWRLIEALGIMG